MENKRQLSTGIVVLITTLVIALIGTISFIVYDKVIKKDEVKDPTTNEVVEKVYSIEKWKND